MKISKNVSKQRFILCLGIVGILVAAYVLKTSDYGFVTGEKAKRRLETYTWHEESHQVRPVGTPADAFLTRRKLIQEAEERIDIAVFLWRDDTSGRILFDDLKKACDRGVKVRILSDGVFFLRKLGRVKAMATAHDNLEIRVFNPLEDQLASMDIKSIDNLGWSLDNMNHRFHIKLFTVDGSKTLLGGRNIGDRYFGFANDYNFIDLDLLIQGAAVEQAETIFTQYWESPLTRSVLDLKDVAAAEPVLKSVPHPLPERFTKGSIGDEWKTVKRMAIWADAPETLDTISGYQPGLLADRLAALLGVVEDNVLVTTPYLVLSERSHDLLQRLREENEDLTLHFVTNSLAASDNWQTYSSFHSQLQWLLEDYRLWIHVKKPHSLREWAGAEESVSSLHTKAWVVDNKLAAVGSFNFDPRSEIFNSEVMAIVDDTAFAGWLREYLAPLHEPENAWVTAKRDLPIGLKQVDTLAEHLSEWASELTGFQAWSLENVSCYEWVGEKVVMPEHPKFHEYYKAVGPFPEVKEGDKKKILTTLMQPVSELIKPAL